LVETKPARHVGKLIGDRAHRVGGRAARSTAWTRSRSQWVGLTVEPVDRLVPVLGRDVARPPRAEALD
jgi:hypothetical protein